MVKPYIKGADGVISGEEQCVHCTQCNMVYSQGNSPYARA